MQGSDSAVRCSSPSKDYDVSPSAHSVFDVGDRDQKNVDTKRSRRMMTYGEMYEILSWMPAKCALKYSSSLCKWLCGIHSEPEFTKKQSIHSWDQDSGLFIQRILKSPPLPFEFSRIPKNIKFHVLPWQTGSNFGIPRESLDYLSKHGHILSSSNGLLLLGLLALEEVEVRLPGDFTVTTFLNHVIIKVCNPATRKWALLCAPEGLKFVVENGFSPLIECYPRGYGVDEFPNDYTIALLVEIEPPRPQSDVEWVKWLHLRESKLYEGHNEKKQLAIYSNGKWDKELCDVSIEGRIVSYDMPVAIFSEATKGLVVHYLCYSDRSGSDSEWDIWSDDFKHAYVEPYIAAFDLREKKLVREIKLPNEVMDGCSKEGRGRLWISKWNVTSICLVRWERHADIFSVWILDECNNEGESWRLLMDTTLKTLGIVNEAVTCVSVASGKGFLFRTRIRKRGVGYVSRVYVYVMEGEHRGRLEVVGEPHVVSNSKGIVTFMPYANTLRPVSLRNIDTFTY